MKIFALNSTGNINTEKLSISKNEREKNNSGVQQSDIAKNSLSEAIGRSQVSFKGSATIKGVTVEYVNSPLIGGSESFTYNKQTGSLEYFEHYSNGKVKKHLQFYPQKQLEIVTDVDNSGVKTVKTTTPEGYQLEKIDSIGERFWYEEYENEYDTKTTVSREPARNREVIKFYNGNELETIEVVDIRSNENVYSGPLVEDDYYDEKTGYTITKNILNGDVYKKIRMASNGRVAHEIDYSRKTLEKIRELKLNPQDGSTTETLYTENGNKTTVIITSKNKREVTTIKYDNDGYTPISHIKEELDKKGFVSAEIVYIPGTDIIKTCTEYEDEDNYTIFTYKNVPNRIISAEDYEDGVLVREIKYFADGETERYVKEYEGEGYYNESYFAQNGGIKSKGFFTPDGILYLAEEYNPDTELIKRSVKIDVPTGSYEESLYSETTGTLRRKFKKDKNDNPIELIFYYQDGVSPRVRRIFAQDGSYVEQKYTTDGFIKEEADYNPDGSKKTKKQDSYNYQQSYQNNQSQREAEIPKTEKTAQSQRPKMTRMDKLNEIAKKLSYVPHVSIEPQDYKFIAEILEIENPDDLKLMDKKLYRKLAVQVHPDKFESESDEIKNLAAIVFEITKALYDRSPNKDK